MGDGPRPRLPVIAGVETPQEALQAPYTPRADFQGVSDDAELARISARLGIKPAAFAGSRGAGWAASRWVRVQHERTREADGTDGDQPRGGGRGKDETGGCCRGDPTDGGPRSLRDRSGLPDYGCIDSLGPGRWSPTPGDGVAPPHTAATPKPPRPFHHAASITRWSR
jgi:hypothetical protein